MGVSLPVQRVSGLTKNNERRFREKSFIKLTVLKVLGLENIFIPINAGYISCISIHKFGGARMILMEFRSINPGDDGGEIDMSNCEESIWLL
ncbi:hypothetical protein AVEN_100441-1 [Araneus ventricosus]|uniref:Uncharacterized protein n=1 Tax=Araneus ventricosus TaxID=182803 RepID=A0A4Y2CYR7_ARAVE|nr:hypothetical protein AVEN_100441-1 [Araneus ventricosus]